MRLVSFLSVFLFACGGSSTGTTASAASGDQEIHVVLAGDAGAPPDAAPAPSVAPTSSPSDAGARACWCASVQVECSGGGDMYARTDRATCTLHLPPVVCDVLGLVEGAAVDPSVVARAAAGPALTADQAYDFCAGRHEASHACDGADVSQCQSEVRAYGVTVACLADVVPRVCDGDLADSGDCERIHLYVDAGAAARELNECVCGGTDCGACTDACLAAHPDVPETCLGSATAYCP